MMMGSTGAELRTSLKAECDYSAKPRVDESTAFVGGLLNDLLMYGRWHVEELSGATILVSRVLKQRVHPSLMFEELMFEDA